MFLCPTMAAIEIKAKKLNFSDTGIEVLVMEVEKRPFIWFGSVVNCFLLKCRKLRREDQETSDWIVSRISLLRTQPVGSCSHRNLNLK